MKRTLEYLEGYNAYWINCNPKNKNPYRDIERAMQWDEGWEAACDEAAGQISLQNNPVLLNVAGI